MYDEVYALYVSFIIDDDGEYETKAYHIPGREAVAIDLGGSTNPLENALISSLSATDYDVTLGYPDVVNRFISIDPTNSRVFHAIATNDNPLASTNMGYWENKDEVYDASTRWSIKAANGSVTSTDLQGANVRHHKFPEAYNHDAATLTPNLTKSIHPDTSVTPNYNLVNLLGIQLSDIVIPDELVGKVKKVNIYYAKRDLNNRTILGQSLLQSLSQIHVGNVSTQGTENTIWNNPGQLVAYNMFNHPPVSKQSGLYPVGYKRTTAQESSVWMYPSSTYTGPLESSSAPFWGKGFYKFKSFDLMSQNIDVNSAVYIKNLYRIKSIYRGTILGTTDLGNMDSNMYTGFEFDPTNSTPNVNYYRFNLYEGIDRIVDESGSSQESLANYIRVITNINYVNQNFPNQREVTNNSPYPFSAIPFNYQGKTGIWLETDYYLYSWNRNAMFNELGNDFPYISYYNNGSFGTDVVNGLYTSPYISNLCVFKLNIFQSFDNQVLCLASSVNLADAESASIYGGDTFTSITSDIDGIDLSAYTPQGTTIPLLPVDARPQNQMRGVHCYIAQSTSNPNYRYEGDNSWETFYPYSNTDQLFTIPQSNPEWYGYNVDYSAVNDIKQPVINPNFPDQTQTYFPNRVIRSAKDNPELQQDNYLDYQAGDYKDFGKIKGKIRNITNQNNKLLIKTDNALYATLGREVISTENAEANVTAGDIFAVKPREIVSSNSYGGGLGRFADIVTQYGYFYPDTTNGIVYNFSGESLDEISKAGKQIFFRNELKFKLPKKLDNSVFTTFPTYNSATTYNFTDYYVTYNNKVWQPTTTGLLGTPGISTDWVEVDYRFKNIDSIINQQSIGVQAAFDYKYRRYILTKKDYEYSGVLPNTYIGNLPDLFTTDGNIVWSNGIFYAIYGVTGPIYAPANSTFLGVRPNGIIDLYIYGVEISFTESFNFIEERFTVAYYPEAQGWSSYYTFYPDAFAYTIDGVYSFTKDYDTKLYKHNSDLQNALFYNREVPYQSFVEPILNQPKGVNRTSSFSIKANSYRKDNSLDYLDMFDSYFVRNSYQISEEAPVINAKTSRNAEGYFNINDFRDMTRDNAKPLMTDAIINEPNASNINANKHWSKQKKFVDYYIIPRLKYFNNWTTDGPMFIENNNYQFTGKLENNTIVKFVYLGVTYVYMIKNVEYLEGPGYIYTLVDSSDDNIISLNDTEILSVIAEIATYDYIFIRELNLLDINTLEHKNTR